MTYNSGNTLKWTVRGMKTSHRTHSSMEIIKTKPKMELKLSKN